MPLYLHNGKLLVKNGKLATHENCCCDDDDSCCCLNFTGDEYLVNGIDDAGESADEADATCFATSGDYFYCISSSSVTVTDSCNIVFNLNLTLRDDEGGGTCTTTGTLTLTVDCDHCSEVHWTLAITPCAGGEVPIPVNSAAKLGDGCTGFDCNSPQCGDCAGFDSVRAILKNPAGGGITDCDVCEESGGGGGGGGGGGDGGDDGGDGGDGDGGDGGDGGDDPGGEGFP